MTKTNDNSDKVAKNTANELSADELNQIAAGMGPVLYSWFRGTSAPSVSEITITKPTDASSS